MFLGRDVLPNESPWTASDRDKIVAYEADKAARCTGCGQHEEDIAYAGLPLDPPLIVPTTYQCFLCTRAEQTYAQIPSADRAGVTVRLMRPAASEE